MRTCLHCGGELPHRPWWSRLIGLGPPPFHDPAGPDGPACWRGLCTRMGMDPNTPMPTVPRRRR